MLIPCSKIPNKKKSELLKKASDFSFAVYDSVSMINTEHWNQLVNYGSEYLKLPFLGVLEKEHPENMHFHYAIIYSNNKPVAIAYFQIIDFSSDSFGSSITEPNNDYSCLITDYLKKHITNHLIKTTDHINMRLLICGNAFVSGEHGFTCSPEANKKEVVDALTDVIYKISEAEKLRGKIAAVLVKDFYPSSIQHTKELEEYKYHDFLVEPNMVLEIQWNSFDEYLNAMSKKYRNRAKNIIKKGGVIERKDFSAEDIKINSNQILQLYNNVHLKAKFRMASLNDLILLDITSTKN
jgi:predicted N-acyltransferase